MLYVPGSNDFRLQISSHGGSRPASGFGSTITPAQNAYGSYVALISGASVTEDCFGILININSIAVSAQNKAALVTIGRDPSGGTTYSDWLTHLNGACASPYNVGSGGVWFYFPMYIKAGTSLAAKASVNNSTVGTARVNVVLFGQPRRPANIRVATKFFSFGENTTTSTGSLVTPGTVAEGSWTALGSTTTYPLWWWQIGYSCNDSTMSAAAIHADLSYGSSFQSIIENQVICTTTTEQINNSPLTAGCVANVASGEQIYGRLQSSTTADSQVAMIAYGCG